MALHQRWSPTPLHTLSTFSIVSEPASIKHSLYSWHREGKMYLIKWNGYGPEKRCWFPAHYELNFLLCQEFCACHLNHTDPQPWETPKWNPTPTCCTLNGGSVISAMELVSEHNVSYKNQEELQSTNMAHSLTFIFTQILIT